MSDFFSNSLYTFGLGFGLGCVFLVMSYWNHWKTKGEFKRYKTHLSDKLELDARAMQETNKEKARLAQENESLRMQVSRLNVKPDNKLQRELEIIGSRNGSRQDAADALQWMAAGIIRPPIVKRVPLDEINSGLQLVRDGTAHGRVIVTIR